MEGLAKFVSTSFDGHRVDRLAEMREPEIREPEIRETESPVTPEVAQDDDSDSRPDSPIDVVAEDLSCSAQLRERYILKSLA